MEGRGVIAAKEASANINEQTIGYVILVINDVGQVNITTGGGIAEIAFMSLSLQSMCHQVVEGRDPRRGMQPTLRPV